MTRVYSSYCALFGSYVRCTRVMPLYLSLCLSNSLIVLSRYLFSCLSVCLSVSLYLCLSFCLYVCVCI
jgi:hypothetical protein